MLKIVNATYSDTSLSIAVFLSAFIICIVSFRQGLFFIKLIRGTKSLFGAIYLLLSDIFMSLFIFCIGLSFFAGLISYKFDTFRTGTLVIYYEEKCDGTKCRFETSRYTIWGKEFETVLGQHDLKNLDDFSNNIELIGAVVDSNAYLKNQDGTSVTGVIFQDAEIGAVIIRLNYSNYDTFWTRLGILFDRIVSDIPRYLKSGFTYYAFLDFEVNISDMNPDYREAISIAYNHPDSFPTLSYYLRTTEGTLNGYIIRRAFSFLFTDQAIEIIKNYAPGLTTSEIAKF